MFQISYFSIWNPSRILIYMLLFKDPYKYAITTFMRCISKPFNIAIQTKYLNVVVSIIGEYVSLQSIISLCIKPWVMSYESWFISCDFIFLITLTYKHSLIFNRLEASGSNTSHFPNESNSVWIDSFYFGRSFPCWHSSVVFGSYHFLWSWWSLRKEYIFYNKRISILFFSWMKIINWDLIIIR